MLYPDREGAVDQAAGEGRRRALPCSTFWTIIRARHRLWPITDPATIKQMQALMADKKLLIADGHHRYETALAYRNENPERPRRST